LLFPLPFLSSALLPSFSTGSCRVADKSTSDGQTHATTHGPQGHGGEGRSAQARPGSVGCRSRQGTNKRREKQSLCVCVCVCVCVREARPMQPPTVRRAMVERGALPKPGQGPSAAVRAKVRTRGGRSLLFMCVREEPHPCHHPRSAGLWWRRALCPSPARVLRLPFAPRYEEEESRNFVCACYHPQAAGLWWRRFVSVRATPPPTAHSHD
jgi:hypothetical protein